jgi:hypothetical protein
MHKQTKAIILVSTFKSYIGHKYLYVVTDVVYVSYASVFQKNGFLVGKEVFSLVFMKFYTTIFYGTANGYECAFRRSMFETLI